MSFHLTDDDLVALIRDLEAKAIATSEAGDANASRAYRDAADMVHRAQLSSFNARAATQRRSRRKRLGLTP